MDTIYVWEEKIEGSSTVKPLKCNTVQRSEEEQVAFLKGFFQRKALVSRSFQERVFLEGRAAWDVQVPSKAREDNENIHRV